MLDISQLFIAHAWAQAAPAMDTGSQSSAMSSIMNFMPLILIFLVFYVLIIRPQQKKIDDQAKMVKALRRGDRVITSGGIYGKVVKVDNEQYLTLEIADNVNVRISLSNITDLEAKPNPAGVPAIDAGPTTGN